MTAVPFSPSGRRSVSLPLLTLFSHSRSLRLSSSSSVTEPMYCFCGITRCSQQGIFHLLVWMFFCHTHYLLLLLQVKVTIYIIISLQCFLLRSISSHLSFGYKGLKMTSGLPKQTYLSEWWLTSRNWYQSFKICASMTICLLGTTKQELKCFCAFVHK